MDRGGGSEALGNKDCPRIVCSSDLPEAPACGAACVIEFSAIVANILKAGKRPVCAVKRNNEPPVTRKPRPMRVDAFAREIRMLGAGRHGLRPDLFDSVCRHLAAARLLSFPRSLRLCQPLCVRHFLDGRQSSPDLGPPVLLDPGPPAAKFSSWDAVRVDDVPARFVPMPALAFRPCAKPVQLPVDLDRVRRRNPCRQHRICDLVFQRRGLLLDPRRERPAEHACDINHLAAPLTGDNS